MLLLRLLLEVQLREKDLQMPLIWFETYVLQVCKRERQYFVSNSFDSPLESFIQLKKHLFQRLSSDRAFISLKVLDCLHLEVCSLYQRPLFLYNFNTPLYVIFLIDSHLNLPVDLENGSYLPDSSLSLHAVMYWIQSVKQWHEFQLWLSPQLLHLFLEIVQKLGVVFRR